MHIRWRTSDLLILSVKQSNNPCYLPRSVRLSAQCDQGRCDRMLGFAATNRGEDAFHPRDFECPIATNTYLWITNSLVDVERFESFQEVAFKFIFATNAATIAVDNNHIVSDQ